MAERKGGKSNRKFRVRQEVTEKPVHKGKAVKTTVKTVEIKSDELGKPVLEEKQVDLYRRAGSRSSEPTGTDIDGGGY